MNTRVRRLGIAALLLIGYGLAAVVVALPIAAEQAMEQVSFDDRLGAVPVEVSLCHDGVSTLDTGVLGRVYWTRTGPAGFGAYVRVTGPPEAGGTLTSYVDPEFVQANAELVRDPAAVVAAYGDQLVTDFWRRLFWIELAVLGVGGALLMVVFRAGNGLPGPRAPLSRRLGIPALGLVLLTGLSGGLASLLFARWDCSTEVTTSYAMPGVAGLSFSSPQTREVAQQVRPFIEKNTERIQEQADLFLDRAEESLRQELPGAAAGLTPRDGERIVLAEADPQGSQVGTRVRAAMYTLLEEHLGRDAIALRTISGDVSSNGAVAEKDFVGAEAAAGGDIPAVAVKGDHDSDVTVQQLEDNGALVPDLDTVEVDGLRVAGGNDPEFKSLFGGLVSNESGTSERQLGESLRETVAADEPVIILLHQPAAALGYLGLDSMTALRAGEGRETTPWDDGIPDLPPGTVNIGHLHDSDGPWVVWNTDGAAGEMVTWTVVDQLGTSGGVEERPTFNRFSTPASAPLKTLSVRLQYVDTESGLQTGYATIELAPDGQVEVTERTDVGLPGGQPLPLAEVAVR